MQEIVPGVFLGPFASATKTNVRIDSFHSIYLIRLCSIPR